jgi:hypothetical protein
MMALRRLIFVLLLVAAFSGVAPRAVQAGPEREVAGGWEVLESHGGVRFRVADVQYWWPVRTGSKIPHGSTVATGRSGFLIIAHGGESITLRASSRVELPAENADDQVRQSAGDLRYRITRIPNRRFSVETPYLSLLVKGTVFDVAVGDRGTQVQVTEGRVRVDAARGQAAELTPGQSARIAPGAQADLEIRSAPDRPFATAPSSRGSIPAAYTNDDRRQGTRDRHPAADQGTDRSDRAPPARVGSSRAVGDAAAVSDSDASGGAGPAGGRRGPASSGIGIGVSDGHLWVDTSRTQVVEVTPDQDTTMARSARADLGTPPEHAAEPAQLPARTAAAAQGSDDGERSAGERSPEAAREATDEPAQLPARAAAAAQGGDDGERSAGDRPYEAAREATDRSVRSSGGNSRSTDALAWAILVVLATALWWRLRRSRPSQSSGHGSARRWPRLRIRSESSSSSGAGSASPGSSAPAAARHRT